MTDVKAGRSTVRVAPGIDVQLPRPGIRLARILSDTFKRWRDSIQRWARPLAADRALVHRAARRLGHPASILRAIMSRSPEALALGPAFHSGVAITALRSGAFLTGLATADWPSLRCGTDALFLLGA